MSLLTELSLITLHWFLTSFASVVHIKLLLRIWDLFFYQGSLVLFQLTLGMLSMKVTPTPTSFFTVFQCLMANFRGKVLYPLPLCGLGMCEGGRQSTAGATQHVRLSSFPFLDPRKIPAVPTHGRIASA